MKACTKGLETACDHGQHVSDKHLFTISQFKIMLSPYLLQIMNQTQKGKNLNKLKQTNQYDKS